MQKQFISLSFLGPAFLLPSIIFKLTNNAPLLLLSLIPYNYEHDILPVAISMAIIDFVLPILAISFSLLPLVNELKAKKPTLKILIHIGTILLSSFIIISAINIWRNAEALY